MRAFPLGALSPVGRHNRAAIRLSQGTTPMTRLAAACLVLLAFGHASHAEGSRPFRMGFTPFPYDITPEAVADTRTFLRENADIIAFHMESVPWAEALSGEPFRDGLIDDWEYKRDIMPPGAKTYVAVSPGRDGLGNYWGDEENQPVPDGFVGKPFDHPDVTAAFANYCERVVRFFDPDYLSIGIEVNEIYPKGAEKWAAHVALHRHVYQELKAAHPDLCQRRWKNPHFAGLEIPSFVWLC